MTACDARRCAARWFGALVLTLASVARHVEAGAPDASTLLAPENARILESLAGRGARLVPRIPARYRAPMEMADAAHLDRAGLVKLRETYPGTVFEAAGPLHTLLDRAALAVVHPRTRGSLSPSGRGVVVAVADTGFDLAHADLRRADGGTRVRWALDFTQPPRGTFGALEEKFALRNTSGIAVRGAVFDAAMIDEALTSGRSPIDDDEGHGTHVTSLAAGAPPAGAYVGMAPDADLVLIRIAGGAYPDITADAIERAAAFAFDRADAAGRPCVLNLSVGTDFGPHDGSLAWEKALAAHVGDAKPGHAIVVAAGNSGRPSDGVHQALALSSRTVVVPFRLGAATEGTVRVWATAARGSTMRIGVRTSDNRLAVAPLGLGLSMTKNEGGLAMAVLHGPSAVEEIPSESTSAVVLVDGRWRLTPPELLVEGEGRADLWFDAGAFRSQGHAGFVHGVREGSVDEPAVHPSLIAVGCTVSRSSWMSASMHGPFAFPRPELDAAGGEALSPSRLVNLDDGEVCDFSGSGPTSIGVPKPEISAPGLAIAGAMSAMATPGTLGSMFTATCSAPGGVLDSRCLQADRSHGFAFGTSMSAPIVAGAVALLLERDASLTQPRLREVLQRSAHAIRSGNHQPGVAGAGELDIEAALTFLASGPAHCEPDARAGFLSASRAYLPAVGLDGVVVRVQARCADGSVTDAGNVVLRIDARLDDGVAAVVEPRGDAEFAIAPVAQKAGHWLTIRAYAGSRLVAPELVLPVGAGPWDARYGVSLAPSCTMGLTPSSSRESFARLLAGVVFAAMATRRHGRARTKRV